MAVSNIKINTITHAISQTVAFASLTYDGLTLTGFSIVARKDGSGYFVSNPQRKGSDGKYYQMFYDPASSYDRETKVYTPGPVEKELHDAILAEFNKKNQTQTPAPAAPKADPAPASESGDGLFDWE